MKSFFATVLFLSTASAFAQKAAYNLPPIKFPVSDLEINDSSYKVGMKVWIAGDRSEYDSESDTVSPPQARCLQKQANEVLTALQSAQVAKFFQQPNWIYVQIDLIDNTGVQTGVVDDKIIYGMTTASNGVTIRAVLNSKKNCLTASAGTISSQISQWYQTTKEPLQKQLQNINKAIFKTLYGRKKTK